MSGALVYSTISDVGVVVNAEPDLEQVTEIADRLATAWYMAASPHQVEALLADRPNIPSDVDRVLLQDASTNLAIYDLPQQTRFALRRQFWEALERIAGRS